MIHHVVVYSGGMDSRTLLSDVQGKRLNASTASSIAALSFNYGQRHSRELNFAIDTCDKLGIPHTIGTIRLPNPFDKSSLTNPAVSVPQGHYADESMKQTVVPGRNTLFLAYALAYAQGRLARPNDSAIIYYGAHAGDHPIYPDCRPEYVFTMNTAINIASEERVKLKAPFERMTKGQILKLGLELGIDYSMTLTCYNGSSPACGKCGACVERLQAFDYCNVKDPLDYEDRESYKTFI